MSDTGDRMIEYEESHWEELVEKFIKKYREKWAEFVYDEYEQYIADYEPPDHYKDNMSPYGDDKAER